MIDILSLVLALKKNRMGLLALHAVLPLSSNCNTKIDRGTANSAKFTLVFHKWFSYLHCQSFQAGIPLNRFYVTNSKTNLNEGETDLL